MISALLLVAIGLDAGQWNAAAAAPLRVAASEANATPFVLIDAQHRIRGGIARDIMDGLAGALGLRAEYLNLPRGRVEQWLRRGDVDAACFLAPAWVSDAAALHWSPVLFSIQQVIVQAEQGAQPSSPQGLHSRRMGTQLNFVYPELQPLFASGQLRREDAPSLDHNLAKLTRGRIDVLVDVDLSVFHRAELGQLPPGLRIDRLWALPNPVYCAFNAEFAAQHPQINLHLAHLVVSGQVDRWIGHYTGGRQLRDD